MRGIPPPPAPASQSAHPAFPAGPPAPGGRPERQRRPKHVLSGLGFCGVCGAPWVKTAGEFWGCSVFRYGQDCANNRHIKTSRYEALVLADLKAGLLSPDAVSEYVREYHRDFARQSADLGRDRARIERKLQEAERKKERMLKAFAEGGSEFAEIRTMLATARDEADRLQRELASMDALPNVLALHPHVEEQYRKQVEDLSAALATPEAQPEAIGRYRAMIARVIVSPDTTKQRGSVVQVVRQMDEILSMATARQVIAQL